MSELNVKNLRIGPCSVVWKSANLGFTLGGVKLTYERKFSDLKVDAYGDSPVDAALTGTNLTVSFKIAEPVAEAIARLLPEGTSLTGANGQQVGFGAGEGASMRAYAGALTLHPLNKAATDTSEDVTLYLAYPAANTELNYEVNNQRAVSVEFRALVDDEFVAGRRLGHIGPVSIS